MPARAADPVFPIGSRLGLVPPPGMVVSKTFQGFADPDKNAAILSRALPAAAYRRSKRPWHRGAEKARRHDREARADQLGDRQGLSSQRQRQTTGKAQFRKWLLVAAASDLTAAGHVQVPAGRQVYSDKVVRDALATLAVRASVPDAEQLSLLPFTVGDMAGFHIDDVLPGARLMLSDAPPSQAPTRQ